MPQASFRGHPMASHQAHDSHGGHRAASLVDHIPWTMVKHSIYLEKLFIIEGDKLGQEGYIRYKSIVGALQYVTLTMTRMDISFPVKMVY